ncbi:MAG TPA: glycosyltransferase, partial [Candidatus Paceibacterota bacterium]
MTKVLFISNDPLMFDAGSAVRSRMRAYKGLFDELHVISRSPLHVSGIVRDGNLILYPLPYGRMMARIMMVSRARAILRHVRGITVVSAQDPFEFGLIGFLARLGASAKLHIQIHTDIYSPHFMFHPPLNILRLLVASFVIRRADGIRVITERLREKIIQKYNSRAHISVLPIFTDIQTFAHMARLKHPRFKIALLTVSRLESEKNIALAIHALRMAREGGHDAGLTIVGDGRERENLLALARSCGLERYVDCVGWKDDVRPYLRAADILLFPSHYDGYGVA